MTTQNPSYFRILPVWLVLLAFLCCMMVPSLAHAKKEMTIATEGDPGDGMDYSGGGGGILDGDSDQGFAPTEAEMGILPSFWIWPNSSFHLVGIDFIDFSSCFVNGEIVIFVRINSLNRRANK